MDPPVSELERLVREKSTIDEYSIINSIQDVATKELDHGKKYIHDTFTYSHKYYLIRNEFLVSFL